MMSSSAALEDLSDLKIRDSSIRLRMIGYCKATCRKISSYYSRTAYYTRNLVRVHASVPVA